MTDDYEIPAKKEGVTDETLAAKHEWFETPTEG